jgi:hypothetical protein
MLGSLAGYAPKEARLARVLAVGVKVICDFLYAGRRYGEPADGKEGSRVFSGLVRPPRMACRDTGLRDGVYSLTIGGRTAR